MTEWIASSVEYDVERVAQAILASDLPDEFAGQLGEARGYVPVFRLDEEEAGDLVTGFSVMLKGPRWPDQR